MTLLPIVGAHESKIGAGMRDFAIPLSGIG
ncbi:unannotated protein [freshwater metagenome]|uniref:Unannotated protein n=1 Tax=freshwater metagenome TaxID=449393 RepID=A0A6J6X3M5_9ZZZZ